MEHDSSMWSDSPTSVIETSGGESGDRVVQQAAASMCMLASTTGTTQKRYQPQRGRIYTQISVAEGIIESRFWEVIGKPMGDCSRLRDQAPRKHDFAWRLCGQVELEEYFAQPSEGSEFPDVLSYQYIDV